MCEGGCGRCAEEAVGGGRCVDVLGNLKYVQYTLMCQVVCVNTFL